MHHGLENAPLRPHVAENVIITAVFGIHHCMCSEARLPIGSSQPVAKRSQDFKEGLFLQDVGFLCR